MEGVKSADFYPKNEVICNPRNNPIDYVLMEESSIPGRGEEKRWCIQFHSGNQQAATIYFDEEDAKTFREKVKESLEGLK